MRAHLVKSDGPPVTCGVASNHSSWLSAKAQRQPQRVSWASPGRKPRGASLHLMQTRFTEGKGGDSWDLEGNSAFRRLPGQLLPPSLPASSEQRLQDEFLYSGISKRRAGRCQQPPGSPCPLQLDFTLSHRCRIPSGWFFVASQHRAQ